MLEKLEKYMELKRGYDLPSYERVNGDYPIVSSSGITEFHNEFKVKGPGVITGRSGTIGEVFFEDRDFWPLNTSLYVKDFKGNNKKFIYYFLKNLDFKHLVSATAVPSLDRKILHNLRVPFIEKSIQNKIAKLLSNYDDLIENNNKRIKLLEQTAEELYKEWFVRLRFPNYQNTKIEDGIPEGWEEKRFSEIIKLQSGYAFKSEDFEETNSQRLVIRMGNFKITGGLKFDSNVKYLNDNVKVKEQYYLSPGDMLIVLSDVTRDGSIIGNVGIVPNNNIKYVLNQRVSKLVFDDFLKYYLYAYFNSFIFKNYCLAHADSATVLNLSNQDLYKHKMVIPSKKVIEKFSNIVKFIYEQIDYFIIKNQTLKETRDLLLPRLLSGKLDIEKMDIN